MLHENPRVWNLKCGADEPSAKQTQTRRHTYDPQMSLVTSQSPPPPRPVPLALSPSLTPLALASGLSPALLGKHRGGTADEGPAGADPWQPFLLPEPCRKVSLAWLTDPQAPPALRRRPRLVLVPPFVSPLSSRKLSPRGGLLSSILRLCPRASG